MSSPDNEIDLENVREDELPEGDEPDSRAWEDSDIVVKTVEHTYNLEYMNGTKGRLVLAFKAHLTAKMVQKGKSSSLLHPIDTRSCSYKVSSLIERTGYVIAPDGTKNPIGTIYKLGGPSDLGSHWDTTSDQVFGHHSPCQKYVKDFQNCKKKIRAEIEKLFDAFISGKFLPGEEKEVSALLSAKLSKVS